MSKYEYDSDWFFVMSLNSANTLSSTSCSYGNNTYCYCCARVVCVAPYAIECLSMLYCALSPSALKLMSVFFAGLLCDLSPGLKDLIIYRLAIYDFNDSFSYLFEFLADIIRSSSLLPHDVSESLPEIQLLRHSPSYRSLHSYADYSSM